MATACEVRSLFDRVAPRYDFLNHLLSGGVDWYWRWFLAKQVKQRKPQVLLDLATGSGDVLNTLIRARAFSQLGIGADFCLPMLRVAQRKATPHLICADGLKLPFQDNSFDAVTISFGFRNLEDRNAGLREMHRVLKPDGSMFILEFSHPWKILSPAYFLYLRHLLPGLAQFFGCEWKDYDYLARSIQAFPNAWKLQEQIVEAGFDSVNFWRLTAGIVALHVGVKTNKISFN